LKRQIIFRPSAETDIRQLTEHSIQRWGAPKTADYLEAIHDALSRLAELPESGSDRSFIKPGLRKLSVGSHPIYYFVEERSLRISRVLHSSQDVIAALESE
jgi:toxin ParE1/3/4